MTNLGGVDVESNPPFSYLKDAEPPYDRSHRLGDRAVWCVMEYGKLKPFRAIVLPILLTGNRDGLDVESIRVTCSIDARKQKASESSKVFPFSATCGRKFKSCKYRHTKKAASVITTVAALLRFYD